MVPSPIHRLAGFAHPSPSSLAQGVSFICLDTWLSVSADTIRLRILKHRKLDESLTPSILEDIADSQDPDWMAIDVFR
ncbi:hypothetical protein LXA43DRAFT_703310 [Ganoderma leucocontextum]|nr:hypothetical protein LXA43DRAFT_703310 [Ganoderma leucocontextum]